MKNKLPQILKMLRINNKLTQLQIANALNISQRAYSYYEVGNREPSIETIMQIANYFNVSIDKLITGIDQNSLSENEQYILKMYTIMTEKNKDKLELFAEQLAKEQEEKPIS